MTSIHRHLHLFLLFLISIATVQAQPITDSEALFDVGFGRLTDAIVSGDGKYIISGGDYGILFWDSDTETVLRILSTDDHKVTAVDITSDGGLVVSGASNGSVILWDVKTSTILQHFDDLGSYVNDVEFSPGETEVLATFNNGRVRRYDISSPAPLNTYYNTGMIGASTGTFSPDGSQVIITALYGGGTLKDKVRILNTQTGVLINELEADSTIANTGIYDAVMSPTGLIATADFTSAARIWNANTGGLIRTFTGHDQFAVVNSVRFSSDGTLLLTGASDGKAILWNVNTGQIVQTYVGHTASVRGVYFTDDDSRIVTYSSDGSVRFWNTVNGNLLETYTGHTPAMLSCAFTPDGASFLTAGLNIIKRWNSVTGALIWEHDDAPYRITDLALSPNGEMFAATRNFFNYPDSIYEAALFDTETGNLIRSISSHTADVHAVAFSPDGSQLFTGSEDGYGRLWDVAIGNKIRDFNSMPAFFRDAVFSADGTKLACATSYGNLEIWDVATATMDKSFHHGENNVLSVAYSSDETMLVGGDGDGFAIIWDIASGNKIHTLEPEGDSVWSVKFISGDTQVLTGSPGTFTTSKDTAEIWDVATGEKLRIFSDYDVYRAAISPDEQRIVTAGRDGVAQVWSINPRTADKLIPRTRDKLIIVAGGGPFIGNPIISQTRELAEYAYFVGTVRGYSPDDIYYISSFDSPMDNDKVTTDATSEAILSAITDWAVDAERLTIMLLDHGTYNSTINEWFFQVNFSSVPRDTLSTSELKAVLDEVQSGDNPLTDIILYVDMCYAGGFLRKCSGSPEGTERVILTSTTDSRLANFGGTNGTLSFTNFFLSSAIRGNSLRDSFNLARDAIVALSIPAGAAQTPWIDDNGDGIPSGADGQVARRQVFGKRAAFGALPPEIIAVPEDLFLDAPQDVMLWCEVGLDVEAKQVNATVSWSGAQYDNGLPITSHLVIPMTFNLDNFRYEAVLPASQIMETGIYTVLYSADADDGLPNGTSSVVSNLAATPLASRIIQGIKNSTDRSWLLYN